MPKKQAANTNPITATFSGISYPANGLPFNVNQSFLLVWNSGLGAHLFQGQPDANSIYPFVKVNDAGDPLGQRVLFNVYKGPQNTVGTQESDVFLAWGTSPFQNVITSYGGTCVLT